MCMWIKIKLTPKNKGTFTIILLYLLTEMAFFYQL